MAATQTSSNARTITYTTGADFCRIFKEDMKNLYLLSLLLTADPAKAEQCFVAALDDCAGNQVFKEYAWSWARRTIVKSALRLIAPEPVYASGVSQTASSSGGTDRARQELKVEISALLDLRSFERFAFVMSVLEGYSDQDCALLLGCTRQAVIAARVRALQEIARSVATQGGRHAGPGLKSHDSVIGLTFPARLATPA